MEGTAYTSPILNQLTKQFLKSKTNVTAKTKAGYKQVLNQFKEHVGQSMPVTKINTTDIKSFCLREKLSNASKRNYLTHLKIFFNWTIDREILESNPCDDVMLPKKRDNLVDKIIEEAD